MYPLHPCHVDELVNFRLLIFLGVLERDHPFNFILSQKADLYEVRGERKGEGMVG